MKSVAENSEFIKGPMLIGRTADDEPVELSSTTLIAECEEAFSSARTGDGGAVMHVEVFRSDGAGKRGGYVIRVRLPNTVDVPWTRLVDGGIELRMAGDEESHALASAIFQAISKITNK